MKSQKKFANVIGKVYNQDVNSQINKEKEQQRKPSIQIQYSSYQEIDEKMNQFRSEFESHLNQTHRFQTLKKRQAIAINPSDIVKLATSIQAFQTNLKRQNSSQFLQKSSTFRSDKQSPKNQLFLMRNLKMENRKSSSPSISSQNSLFEKQQTNNSPRKQMKIDLSYFQQQTNRVQERTSTFKINSLQNQSPKNQLNCNNKKKINQTADLLKLRPNTSKNQKSNYFQQSLNQNEPDTNRSKKAESIRDVQQRNSKQPYLFSDFLKLKSQQSEESQIQSPRQLTLSQRKSSKESTFSPINQRNRIKTECEVLEQDNNSSSITKLFGNQLISSLLQALIIKEINKLYGVKYNGDSGITLSDQLIKMFDIDLKILKSIKTLDERKKYLIKKMDEKIDNLLQLQERKHYERQKTLNEENQDRQNDDHFKWLNIKSKYDAFKKKLKIIMVQKINLYENQTKIIEELQKSMHNTSDSQVQSIKTEEESQIRQKSASVKQTIDDIKNLKIVDARSIIYKLNAVQDLSYKNGERSHNIKNFSNIKLLADIQKDKQLYLQNITQKQPYEYQVIDQWDDEKEKLYQKQKKNAIQNYINTNFNSSKVTQLSFQPFVYTHQKQLPQHYNRQKILEKYENGIQLSNEEYEFVANTSKLLNKCIDKKFVQQGVDTLSENIIDYLERDLAEDIIMNHELIFEKLKSFRSEYFKNKNEILEKKFKEQRINEKLQQINQKKQKESQTFLRIIRNRLNKLVDQNPIRQASYKNFFILFFVHKLKLRLEYLRHHKKIYATRFNPDALEQINKLKEKELTKQRLREFIQKISPSKEVLQKIKFVNTKRHDVHPPSVLSYFKPLDKNDIFYESYLEKQENQEQQMQPKIESLKLKMKDEKNQDNFCKFYSGGPNEGKPQIVETQFTKIKESDIEKIIKIQRLIRRFRILKIVKRIKKQEFEKKVHLYQKKLDKFLGNHSPFYQAMRINESTFKLKMIQQKKDLNNFNEQFLLNLSSKSRSTSLSDSTTIPQSRFKTNTQTTDIEPVKRLSNAITIYTSGSDEIHEGNSHTELTQLSQKKNAEKISIIKQFEPQPHRSLQKMKDKLHKRNSERNLTNTTISESQSTRRNTFHSKESTQTKQSNYFQTFTGIKKSDFLMKQQKLLQSAKNNFFLSVKNAGFVYSPSDTMIKDQEGNSPLYYAVLNKNEEFVNWLLNKGASPNQICSSGNTPMHLGFQTQNQQEQLIKYSLYSNYMQIIQSLLNWGGDINKVNIEGFTPLAYCTQELLEQLQLSKCIIYSSKQKFEKHITNFDNQQYFFRPKDQSLTIERLQLNNYYPLDVSQNRTILLNNQKSE